MPPKQKQKSKGNNRKKYTTHIVDAATEARLNPMPNISTASSSQGSPGSSQASVAAPAMGSAPPPTYIYPPLHLGYYGTVPPFGTFPPPSYQFPPYSIPPQNHPLPQQQQIPPQQNPPFPQQQQIPPQQNSPFPQQQIPPQQNPPFPQQQQNPPQPQQQPQQENVVEEGGGELVMFHDVIPDYPRDSLRRYILKPSGNSFLPCKPAAEAIKSIIHNCYGHFWKTYGDLDDNEKDRWFSILIVIVY
ncbi:hypothetical protein MtrunA17_Chr0c01g0489551 [Medicago truncatula]|uniref:Uncharacterized protein n=1 Tax=Medicago truncatula TaxID=3880 RepID=A0A396G9Q2_MEDTR|nr:hypothetical protein MtrunA17_Chr0c01g0489551 [Medicago truncatula]